jgi:Family of unknown function (DUF6174)
MSRPTMLGACLVLSACGSATEDHEALWRAQGPSSYQYTYATGGSALHVQLRVTVLSRAVSSVVVLAPPEPVGTPRGYTVEQLFEDIRKRLDRPCKTTARYDASLGYPRSTYSDCGMEGDGWTVTDLASGP